MKSTTILRAYKRAESRKRNLVRVRGTNQGIAVQDDPYALRWQRRDRQSRKFYGRLERLLGTTDDLLAACEETRARLIGLAAVPPADRERTFAYLWPKINDVLRTAIAKAREAE